MFWKRAAGTVDLDIDHVRAGLAEGSILLVDVREPHEFAAGRIPGSVSMPLSTFDARALPEAGGREIVFSCAAGVRSLNAIDLAEAAGLPGKRHYRGGFKEWVQAGGPIER